ncbi:MAG: hypothetical protein A2289_25155 [Deltaproteobacteria bacterium RIFOXYA12_FULL_58_15]|nr:MAG: hypothetical protein A2289_25155 [Deltaproteobacteria bacterium RIFOXYA12_FULL_58_15]
MQLYLVTPPPTKPCEPGLSAAAAAELLRRLGVETRSIDGSMAWHRFMLSPDNLAKALLSAETLGDTPGKLLAYRRAVRTLTSQPPALRKPATYQDRQAYTSAIGHFENLIGLAARLHPTFKLGVAQIASNESYLRPESSAWLKQMAESAGPFDDYFTSELIPKLADSGANIIGVSLTFQQQAPAAFRLAYLLERHLPNVPRILGGPLVACWRAVDISTQGQPFTLFHRIVAGDDADLAELASELTQTEISTESVAHAATMAPLSIALDEGDWDDYLAPMPIVPAALGRGCYWRRCTFCPDHLHAARCPTSFDGLDGWLHAVAERFPNGAMLHLTDSALPPSHLARLSDCISKNALPLSWHGFVRVEEEFADADFVGRLASGGCAMLQLGVESASHRLLQLMGKGHTPELAREVLHTTAAAGIRNCVYLLFGFPSETDADREQTLALVEDQVQNISAINAALLNLPRGSPMHRKPSRFGITRVEPFHADTELSLYVDFYCGEGHPRTEARRWLDHHFFKSAAVRSIIGGLRSPMKANHLCFL